MRLKVKSYSRLQRLTTSVAAVLGLVAILILGCAPKPKLLPEDRTPRKVLEYALENQAGFETLACLLNLKLRGEEGKFSGTVEFFYRHPDTFSLYPRTFLGIGGFKAMGEGDSLTIYFPRRNEYYRGSFSDFEKSGLWSWEISLNMLFDLIVGKSRLTAENAEYAGKAKDLFLYKTEEEGWIREYWVDSKRCRLARSRWAKEPGGEFYQIEYRNFTTHGNVEVPRDIRIETWTNDSARLKFMERKFDSPIPSDRFQIKIPADAQRVVFETRKSG
ncbi:MAG: DUF4292 domain-containing protein [Candidatus Zixiibacteriota bacterium]